MNLNQPTLLKLVAIALVSGGFAACTPSHDKADASGAIPTPPPTAVIALIGQTPVTGAPVSVRSGANVVLSGKDSIGSGNGDPVVGYTWIPQNDAAKLVTLIERSVNTVAFIAPLPGPADASPLVLQFGLKVTTASGLTATTGATINVYRVPDPDNFILTDIKASSQQVAFNVVAATTATICGTASAGCTTGLHADVPFTISAQKTVTYTTVQNTTNTVKIGAPIVLTGSWRSYAGTTGAGTGTDPAAAAAVTAASAFNNPTFRLRPPSVNIDEVNMAVLCAGAPPCTFPDANSGVRQNEMQIADVDSARAYYEFSFASPGNGVDTSPTPVLLVTPGTGGVGVLAVGSGSGMALDVYETDILDALRSPTKSIESLTSAQAYYAALDSQVPKTTLAAWLKDNCFTATAPYGADAKATYVNNFDLGFGREMYFKTDCANPAAVGATIQTANGERAAVVFNYSTLENAIQRNGAFAAVAMEYRADVPGTGEPYTRFYTFAPDQRTGDWVRVSSFDFDGRGQKYTPGNCTVCHGGKPRGAYTASGGAIADLGAVFLPWDQRNLLFADSAAADVDPTLQAGFTVADQASSIQALNLKGTMSTLNNRAADTAPIIQRRQNQRDLICGFYGITTCYTGANYPAWTYTAGAFDPTFLPVGWTAAVTDPNSSASFSAADLKSMYSDVVAQHCRGCHMQRIAEPASAASTIQLAAAPQFANASELFTPKPVNSGISVYNDMKAGVLFGRHIMPGSRLTADRFWAGFGSPADATCTLFMATTPACTLAKLLGFTDDAASVPHPVAVIANTTPAATPSVSLDGTLSLFANSFDWALSFQSVPGYQSAAKLIGDSGAQPTFLPDAPGYYTARLSVTDSTGVVGPVDPATRPSASVVIDALPLPGAWSLSLPAFTSTEFDLLTAPGATSATQSVATLGDEPNVFSITDDAAARAAGLIVALAACPATLPLPYTLSGYAGPTAAHCVTVDASSATIVPGTYMVGLGLQDHYTAGNAAPGSTPGTTVASVIAVTVPSAGQLTPSPVSATCGAYVSGATYTCSIALPVQCDVQNQFSALPAGWYAIAQIDTNAWLPVNGRPIPGAGGPNVGSITPNGTLAAAHITAAASCGATVTVAYQPPQFFVSNHGGGSASVTEQIPYQIQLFNSSGTPLSAIGVVDANITVTVTRTIAVAGTGGVKAALTSAGCNSCHNASDLVNGQGWGLTDASFYNELTDTQLFRAYPSNGANTCPVDTAAYPEVTGERCIDFSHPQHGSLILAKPNQDTSVYGSLVHGGGDQSGSYNSGETNFQTVLRWINEGAFPD